MARNTITEGPSKWDLMLVTFDEHPANAMGSRNVRFTLQCGYSFNAWITSVEKPDPRASQEERGMWILRGETTNLPHGYYYSDRKALTIKYDPHSRKGCVDLQLMCPDCGHNEWKPEIIEAMAPGDEFRACCRCGKASIMRKHGEGWVWRHNEILRQRQQYGHSIDVVFLADEPINF